MNSDCDSSKDTIALEITVPSKTFIVGEYLVTQNGPALLLNTSPRFKLILKNCSCSQKAEVCEHKGIPPHSPAGKFIQKHAAFFNDYQVVFIDPHNEAGGFGASSARFLMMYAAKKFVEAKKAIELDIDDLLSTYQQFAWDGVGIPPSGADLVSQYCGQLTYFQQANKTLEPLAFPFGNQDDDLDFFIFKTQYKIATHLHLIGLKALSTETLVAPFNKTLSGLLNHDSEEFISGINGYHQALLKKDLVCEQTVNLIEALKSNASVLAAKGCGALGADVIFLVANKKNTEEIKAITKKLDLTLIATNADISKGIEVRLCE